MSIHLNGDMTLDRLKACAADAVARYLQRTGVAPNRLYFGEEAMEIWVRAHGGNLVPFYRIPVLPMNGEGIAARHVVSS